MQEIEVNTRDNDGRPFSSCTPTKVGDLSSQVLVNKRPSSYSLEAEMPIPGIPSKEQPDCHGPRLLSAHKTKRFPPSKERPWRLKPFQNLLSEECNGSQVSRFLGISRQLVNLIARNTLAEHDIKFSIIPLHALKEQPNAMI